MLKNAFNHVLFLVITIFAVCILQSCSEQRIATINSEIQSQPSSAGTTDLLSNQLFLSAISISSSCPKFGKSTVAGSYDVSKKTLSIVNTLTQCTLNSGEVHDGIRRTSGNVTIIPTGYTLSIVIDEDLTITSQDKKTEVKYLCSTTKKGNFNRDTNQFIGSSLTNACQTSEITQDVDGIGGYLLKEVDLGFIRTNKDQIFAASCLPTQIISNGICTEVTPVKYTVSLQKNGSGGSIFGDMSCSGTCTTAKTMFNSNTTIKLSAFPIQGYRLASWGGDCSKTSPQSSCILTVTSAKNVIANFEKVFVLNIKKLGNGTISYYDSNDPSKIDECGSLCSDFNIAYPAGTQVTLTPKAGNKNVFTKWTGTGTGCINNTNISSTCVILINSDQTITANFIPTSPTVVTTSTPILPTTYIFNASKNIYDSGRVQCFESGLTSLTVCGNKFNKGASVYAVAYANPGYVFVRWDGGCSQSGNKCSLTLSKDTNITAIFRKN